MKFEPRRPAAAAAADPCFLLLKQHLQQPPASDGHPRRSSSSWPTAVGLGFLTFNTGMAAHRSRGDIAFVAFSYLDLLALFLCLRWYEGAQPRSPLRRRLKLAVWLLTTALTLAFSSRVAALMPVAAAAVAVWLVAFGTVAGGFYAFFLSSSAATTTCDKIDVLEKIIS
ncbi:unnamed protein product [Urochloa decumbens]|uniref:Uncharacterized protein n=1 Tax=Urochloa decumbens TaxID=240449 RepID=A0ABC8VEB9_9POAL